ncbi:MAG TPA: hypothetical protein VGW30_07455 [Gaiellaceae bacterium]|nr:hypothetical protein [Gaiellaceae bacterium]
MAFLYLGGVAFVLGSAVAFLAASTWRRAWLLVWLGGGIGLGGLARAAVVNRRELREQRGAA